MSIKITPPRCILVPRMNALNAPCTFTRNATGALDTIAG